MYGEGSGTGSGLVGKRSGGIGFGGVLRIRQRASLGDLTRA